MGNVLLLHFDGGEEGGYPNLALAQLYAMHRHLGDRVDLRNLVADPNDLHPRLGDPTWDIVYGSLIFERSRPLAEAARRIYPDIILGGTGWDFENGIAVRHTELPDGARCTPDLDHAYPLFKPSIGFAMRGCRFKCGFCVVPSKEGGPRASSSLAAIWRGDRFGRRRKEGRIVLLDNDFFGNPSWRDVIAEAREHNLALAVIQGINVRLLKEEEAAAILSVRWMAGDFSRRRVYTAWDQDFDERRVMRGLGLLKAAGETPDAITVYMLIGHKQGETHEDRDHRRRMLRDFGCRPYPMPYTREGDLGHELVAFQNWCLQRKDVTDPATGQPFVPWEKWWGKAKGNVRKLGTRRVSLPLFPDEDR